MGRYLFYLILPFLFLFVPDPGYGQSETDSLSQELKTIEGLARARLLIELSSHTRQTDVQEAINQATEALRISNRLGDEKLEAKSRLKLGFYHSLKKENGKALEYYLAALQIVRENGYKHIESAALHDLGRFYAAQDNYSKALDYYFKSMRIKEVEGDKSGSAVTLQYIGIIYNRRGEPDEALNFYEQAYNLGKEAKNFKVMSMVASDMAIIYQDKDSLETALSYYEKALDAAKIIHSTHAQATILLYMSSAYRDQNLFRKALDLNKKQIELAQDQNSTFLQAQGFENLGGLYRDQGNLEQSNRYFQKAKFLYDQTGLSKRGYILNKLARNFIKQGRLAEAISTSKEALKQAKNAGNLENMQSSLELLTQAYTEQGNYQNALTSQAELIAVKDSLFNKEQARQIAQMQTRYETQQKEEEIVLLQKKREKDGLIRDAFAAGLVLIIIIGFLIYKRQQLKIRKNEAEIENTHLKEQQLKQDLAFKNKQLTTHSLNLVQKNEMMRELKQNIGKIKKETNGKMHQKLRNLEQLVNYSFNLDEDWEEFKLYFEEVHTGFFDVLKREYPDLTPGELRLSALVKLHLTIKEIATIMSISPDSVKTARYRLRKKLNMKTEENLTDFMMDVEKGASGKA